MSLKITTDDLNITISFEGSSSDGNFTDPSVLLCRNVAISTEGNNINIIDKQRTVSKGTTSYHMYGVPFDEFLKSNNGYFDDILECRDYIEDIISPKRNIVSLDGSKVNFELNGSILNISIRGIGSTALNLF